MPPKSMLKFEDYTFYFVPNRHGKYSFKDVQGDVFRLPNTAFTELYKKLSSEDIKQVQTLVGFANIRVVTTGKYLLVYEIFADLSKELDPETTSKSRNKIYLNRLHLEIKRLQLENQTLHTELETLRRAK